MASRKMVFFICVLLAQTAVASFIAATGMPQAYSSSLIREEQSIRVNGFTETWQLRWGKEPSAECAVASDMSFTCPCKGFAYAESGPLDLIRIRNGREVERISLGELFEDFGGGNAIVQRWESQSADMDGIVEHIFDEEWQAKTVQRFRSRPPVRVMKLMDYDHDGRSTEFFLQTGTAPCGKILGVVIGTSNADNRLHIFGSLKNPRKPLVLQQFEWEMLQASARQQEILDWNCEDHGSEREVFLRIGIANGGIQARHDFYECRPDGKRGRLVESIER